MTGMTGHSGIDPARSAVLSMDFQNGIVSRSIAKLSTKPRRTKSGGANETPPLVQRAASVLKRARSAGIRVIHVRVGFRPNLPEISARNALFSSIKNSAERQSLFQGNAGEIHADLMPESEEVVIVKHRVSAFAGTTSR